MPIIVNTGKFTGRSPKDRYFVKTKLNEKVIDWGTRNNPISESEVDRIWTEMFFSEINWLNAWSSYN